MKSNLELKNSSQICLSCREEIEKNKNKFLVRQVLAVEESASELEAIEARELNDTEMEAKRARE